MNGKLPPGVACAVALAGGAVLKGKGPKHTCRCILHDDKSASAWVSYDNNTYGCSVCFPGSAISAKELCERKGLDWKSFLPMLTASRSPRAKKAEPEVLFPPGDAVLVWHAAYARARNDDFVEADRATYAYLATRGLMEAWECGVFGVLGDGMTLPAGVAKWPSRRYSIVAPLYDAKSGALVSIQSRAIWNAEVKTLVPKGGRLAGTTFADARALAILRGQQVDAEAVVYGEGLTDMLALSISAAMPVFTAPGTGNAVSAVGPWARGRRVLLAMDCDPAGRNVLKGVSDALYAHGATRIQRIVWPKPAKDACDLVASIGTVGLAEFLQRQLARGAA